MVEDKRYGRAYTIYMKERENEFLRSYAHSQGITSSAVIRRAIRLLQLVTDLQKDDPSATLFVRENDKDVEIKIIL